MGKRCGKTEPAGNRRGLRRLTAGRVVLREADVTLPPSERIGYVPQDRALFSTMTVADHLAFALRVRGEPRRNVNRRRRTGRLAGAHGLCIVGPRISAVGSATGRTGPGACRSVPRACCSRRTAQFARQSDPKVLVELLVPPPATTAASRSFTSRTSSSEARQLASPLLSCQRRHGPGVRVQVTVEYFGPAREAARGWPGKSSRPNRVQPSTSSRDWPREGRPVRAVAARGRTVSPRVYWSRLAIARRRSMTDSPSRRGRCGGDSAGVRRLRFVCRGSGPRDDDKVIIAYH